MKNNHIYDLLSQIVQEHRSIWRIKKFYLKDSKGCKKCQEFWKNLEKEKLILIEDLVKLLKEHKEF